MADCGEGSPVIARDAGLDGRSSGKLFVKSFSVESTPPRVGLVSGVLKSKLVLRSRLGESGDGRMFSGWKEFMRRCRGPLINDFSKPFSGDRGGSGFVT